MNWLARRQHLLFKNGISEQERTELEALDLQLKEHMKENPNFNPGDVPMRVTLGDLLKAKGSSW